MNRLWRREDGSHHRIVLFGPDRLEVIFEAHDQAGHKSTYATWGGAFPKDSRGQLNAYKEKKNRLLAFVLQWVADGVVERGKKKEAKWISLRMGWSIGERKALQ